MLWKKRIPTGEKVGIKLNKAERALLLTGMVYIPEEVEQSIRDTPASARVRISLSGVESLAGHVAGEANHARDKEIERGLDGIFIKVEELLDAYTGRDETGHRG
jgi:hypothetical protein